MPSNAVRRDMNVPERHIIPPFGDIYPVRRQMNAPDRDMDPGQRDMKAGHRDMAAPPRQMKAPRRGMDAGLGGMNAARRDYGDNFSRWGRWSNHLRSTPTKMASKRELMTSTNE